MRKCHVEHSAGAELDESVQLGSETIGSIDGTACSCDTEKSKNDRIVTGKRISVP